MSSRLTITRLFDGKNVASGALALGGMVVGAIVGIGVQGSVSDPAALRKLNELAALLARQSDLQGKSADELGLLQGELESLRRQSIDDRGIAGGADVWLGVGESISVGDSNHVFGVVRI